MPFVEFHANLERTAAALERIADALERAFPKADIDRIAGEPSGEVLSPTSEDLRRWEEEETIEE